MRARRVGEHAVLVECDDAASVTATYDELRDRAPALGAVDVVPAARAVLLDGLPDARAALATVLDLPEPRPLEPEAGSGLVEIPTTYDGEDLDEVARQWQVSTA